MAPLLDLPGDLRYVVHEVLDVLLLLEVLDLHLLPRPTPYVLVKAVRLPVVSIALSAVF